MVCSQTGYWNLSQTSSLDGETHLRELAQLAEKDPEFFKYLQENDKELLEFDPSKLPKASGSEDGEDDGDVEMEDQESLKTLTTAVLKKWQRALLEACVSLVHVLPHSLNPAAKLTSSSETTSRCLQIRCIHERQRKKPYAEMAD